MFLSDLPSSSYCSVIVLALVAPAALIPSAAQVTSEAKPRVSAGPLTAEQLAVYRFVLGNWMQDELSTVNLSIQTESTDQAGPFGPGDCGKGLDLEPVSPGLVHRFRPEDLLQLGSGKIVLVDPDRQRKEVAENDPERGMSNGQSVEEAVRNGFAHGLVTLGEIRFSRDHKLAIVSYGFFCGSLCGNGGALVLEKSDSGWRRKSRCGEWVS